MSIIIREQDILSKEPPRDRGEWDAESIRAYQEQNGINYAGTVFVRGVSPNREWSNDRFFGQTAVRVENLSHEPQAIDEVAELKAQIQGMKELIAQMNEQKEQKLHISSQGLERQGLERRLDKRTAEYKKLKAEGKVDY